jgi:hypothetical protein
MKVAPSLSPWLDQVRSRRASEKGRTDTDSTPNVGQVR